jgi:N-acetylgalactosamine kinase
VCLFGIAECLRSRDCVQYLTDGDVAGFGRLMTISHDGDRIGPTLSDGDMDELIGRSEQGELRLMDVPGGYGCSTREIDAMVDIALSVEGVAGAQLAGAGLGGCIMALARDEAVVALSDALVTRYYEPAGIPARIAPCIPVQGAGLIDI